MYLFNYTAMKMSIYTGFCVYVCVCVFVCICVSCAFEMCRFRTCKSFLFC